MIFVFYCNAAIRIILIKINQLDGYTFLKLFMSTNNFWFYTYVSIDFSFLSKYLFTLSISWSKFVFSSFKFKLFTSIFLHIVMSSLPISCYSFWAANSPLSVYEFDCDRIFSIKSISYFFWDAIFTYNSFIFYSSWCFFCFASFTFSKLSFLCWLGFSKILWILSKSS